MPASRQRSTASFFRCVILEKIPLLALSAGSCVLTCGAKPRRGLQAAGLSIPCDQCLAFLRGLHRSDVLSGGNGRAICASGAETPSGRTRWIPLAVLVSITLAVVWLGWRRRYLAVGWFWYLGMLVPVIGLVQVGAQARADRYTYLTQIGLYIMIAWGLSDLARAWRGRTALYAAVAAPIIAVLAAVAWMQTSYWQNSLTLWEHSVACQPETNDFAQNEYGVALADAGRVDEAMEHYVKAVEINPKYLTPRTATTRATCSKQGKSAEALEVCDEALEIDPDDAAGPLPQGRGALWFNRREESIREFQIAHREEPEARAGPQQPGGSVAAEPAVRRGPGRMPCGLGTQPRTARGPSHDGQYSAGEERSCTGRWSSFRPR